MTGNTKKEAADCPACFPWGKKEYTHTNKTQGKNNETITKKKEKSSQKWNEIDKCEKSKKWGGGGRELKNMISHSPFALYLLDTISWQKVISLDIVLLLYSSMFPSQPGVFCWCPVMSTTDTDLSQVFFVGAQSWGTTDTDLSQVFFVGAQSWGTTDTDLSQVFFVGAQSWGTTDTDLSQVFFVGAQSWGTTDTELSQVFFVGAQSWGTTDTETEIISAENPKLSNVLSVPFRH